MLLFVTRTRCACSCHETEEPVEFGRTQAPSVSRTDPVAAITACTACQHAHCLAFSGRPPELRTWNPTPLVAWEPPKDAPKEGASSQGDGHG